MIDNYADAVVMSGEYDFLSESLSRIYHGMIIKTKANPYLDKRVAFHPDMQFLDFGSVVFILKGSEYLEEYFIPFNKQIVYTSMPSNEYPKDVLCNGKIIGNNLICNKKTIFRGILDYAEEKGYNILGVNQGYTGCSVLAVNSNTVITGDLGIFNRLSQGDLRAYHISQNQEIKLPGYDCGFIGGCGGFYGEKQACLTGSFKSEEEMKYIEDIFQKKSVKLNILTDNPILDVGGIVSIYKYEV